MNTRTFQSALGILPALALLAGGGALKAQGDSEPDLNLTTGPAAQYCADMGGVVEHRHPFYGTSNPNPLRLAGTLAFCSFTASDGSSIHLSLETLYTKHPTLATLAYYAKVTPGKCTGNPASCYCSLLGGTDLFGGINAAGGAWVNKTAPITDLDACIFPDMSTIDSWGLTYHSAGIIRGIDLAKVLRYPKP